jgi:GNAT superfamily N-acetyltransferase
VSALTGAGLEGLDVHALGDERGPLLSYVPGERMGRPLADLVGLAPGRSAAEAVASVRSAWAGWVVATPDPNLAAALRAAGAEQRRRATVMSAALPSPAAAMRLPTVPRRAVPVRSLLPGWRAAYPAGHPDHESGTDEEVIASCWDGYDTPEYAGAEHRSGGIVLRAGRPIGGIIVGVREEPAPWGGPWVNDIWVDPAFAGHGIGTALLGQAQFVLHRDGFTTLGLVVSHGNPARRLYERCGFREVLESWTLLLPPGPPASD